MKICRISFPVLLLFSLSACPGPTQNTKAADVANSIWVQSAFFRGYFRTPRRMVKEQDIVELAAQLKQHKVRYAYIFAGPFRKDGSLPKYPFSPFAHRTVNRLREIYPDLQVLPWVGGLQNRTVSLGDQLWVKRALAETERLVRSLGVPGVHTDFELILPSSTDVLKDRDMPASADELDRFGELTLEFHKGLRALLPEHLLSTAIGPTAKAVRLWKRQPNFEEVLKLAAFVDQFAFMNYDTRITDKQVYQAALIEQLEDIQRWKVALGRRSVQFLLGVGTFVNHGELEHYRDPVVEGLEHHFTALRAAEETVRANGRLVDGSAIFAEWTTSADEWERIARLTGADPAN